MDSSSIRMAILQFLQQQNEKKSASERKQFKTASDEKERLALAEKIAQFDRKYSFDVWIPEEAMKLAGQINFGTHISKGIHADSKGDNINFLATQPLPPSLIGSQTISTLRLDANGNAAALPLATFLNLVVDEETGCTLRQLLAEDSPLLEGVFSDDLALSEHYKQQFQQTIKGNFKCHTFEKNKQILWVNNLDIAEDDYICIIPLYPSSLTHHFYQQINQLRYSEQNKKALENRYREKKAQIEQQAYISIKDIASIKLGGTKPQNISQLTSLQGGRNYLLPSLPPISCQVYEIKISPTQKSIFDSRLAYRCRDYFSTLNKTFNKTIYESNSHKVRERVKEALNAILQEVLAQAQIYQQKTAGWSQDYELVPEQKYWLDPRRATLPSQQEFAQKYFAAEWVSNIGKHFALWFQQQFPKKKKNQFNQEDISYLRQQIVNVIRAQIRAGGNNE